MSKPVLLLAVFVAAATMYFVLLWPASPLWTNEDVGTFLGFSPDSRLLITATNLANTPNPEVCRWDARTGALVSRVAMRCSEQTANRENFMRAVRPSPNGTIALVGEGVMPDFGNIELAAGQWYVHDGLTGQRLTGPLEGVNYVPLFFETFSPDSRWFYAYRGDPTDGSMKRTEGFDIFATANGKRVVELPRPKPGEIGQCVFSSDGDSAVIGTYRPSEHPESIYTIRILELPSGRERARHELPKRKWRSINRWDSQRLVMSEQLPDGPGKLQLWGKVVFDLTKDPLSDGHVDPLLRDTPNDIGEHIATWHGANWVVHSSFAPPGQKAKGLAGYLDKVSGWFGIAKPQTRKRYTAWVRFLDPQSGAMRYEMPRPIPITIRISPDGRLIGGGGNGPIEVWDADPPSRWPLALAAGLGAGAGIVGLSRLRFRSRIVRSQAGAPIAPNASSS